MRVIRRFKVQAWILAAVAVAAGSFHIAGLRFNVSPSLPIGLYRLTDEPIRRGALVAACLPPEIGSLGRERGYLGPGRCPGGAQPVLKLVGAVAGDVVEIGDGVRVNAKYLQPAPPSTDRAGRPLNPLRAGRHELAPGKLWLYSPSARSWDSRFFGPVTVGDILGVVQPLWTSGPGFSVLRSRAQDQQPV